MSFDSNPSSLRAQNGSAYGDYPSSHSTNGPTSSSSNYRQLCDPYSDGYSQEDQDNPSSGPSTARRDYDTAGQYNNTRQSYNSTNQHGNLKSSHQVTDNYAQYSSSPEQYTTAAQSSGQRNNNSNSGQYHLPVYNPDIPRYANELSFDDDNQNSGPTAQYSSIHDTRPRTPATNNTYQSGVPLQHHSPTTDIWSRSTCSEERIRLGLPRKPSDEEQHRAFENVADPRRGY